VTAMTTSANPNDPPDTSGLSEETKRMIDERIARLDASGGQGRTVEEIVAAAKVRRAGKRADESAV